MIKDENSGLCRCFKKSLISKDFKIGGIYEYDIFRDNKTKIWYYAVYVGSHKKSYSTSFFDKHFIDVEKHRNESISKILD